VEVEVGLPQPQGLVLVLVLVVAAAAAAAAVLDPLVAVLRFALPACRPNWVADIHRCLREEARVPEQQVRVRVEPPSPVQQVGHTHPGPLEIGEPSAEVPPVGGFEQVDPA
jgi:hypothetical protein